MGTSSWCCTGACTLGCLVVVLYTSAAFGCPPQWHPHRSAAHLSYLLVVLHSVKRPRLHPVWCRASTLGCLECGAELSILNCEALQFQVWKGPHTEEEYAHIN